MPWVVLAAALLLPSFADAASGPLLSGSPWPAMRRDLRNTADSPIRGGYRGGDRAWSLPDRPRDLLDAGDRRRRAPSTSARPTATSTRSSRDRQGALALRDRRDHRRRRGARARRRRKAASDHHRLGRRGALQAAHRPRADLAQEAHRSGASTRRSRPRPGRSSTGGRATSHSAPTATLYVGNTGGGTYAISPDGRQRWAYTARQLGVDDACLRARRQRRTGARSTSTSSRSTRTATQRWQHARRSAIVTSSPALGPDGTVYVGLVRLQALRARPGDRRRALDVPDRATTSTPRRRSATRTAHDAIYIASTDGSVYARRRPTAARALALRHRRPGPLLAGARPRAAGDGRDRLRRLVRTAGSTRSTPRPASAAGPTTRLPATPCCATATTSTARPRSASAASTSAASTAGTASSPTTAACNADDGRCSTTPGQAFGDNVNRVLPGHARRQHRSTGRLREGARRRPSSATRLVVRRDGRRSTRA